MSNRDPDKVPAAISVKLFELGPQLAAAANAKGISLGEEIRRRLRASLQADKRYNKLERKEND